MNPTRLSLLLIAAGLAGTLLLSAREGPAPLKLNLRSRDKDGKASVKAVEWDPKKTAVFICDMWDDHWCRSAARRVGEMSGPLDKVIGTLRERGVFVVHAPSSVTAFYKDTPQRKRALDAPFAKTPVELSSSPRWGTAWCWTDGKHEGVLPIDDSDM